MQRRMKPGTDRLAITLGSRQLTRHEHGHIDATGAAKPKLGRQQLWGVDERVAMHDAITRELGLLQTRDHTEHALLLGERQVGLETH